MSFRCGISEKFYSLQSHKSSGKGFSLRSKRQSEKNDYVISNEERVRKLYESYRCSGLAGVLFKNKFNSCGIITFTFT